MKVQRTLHTCTHAFSPCSVLSRGITLVLSLTGFCASIAMPVTSSQLFLAPSCMRKIPLWYSQAPRHQHVSTCWALKWEELGRLQVYLPCFSVVLLLSQYSCNEFWIFSVSNYKAKTATNSFRRNIRQKLTTYDAECPF